MSRGLQTERLTDPRGPWAAGTQSVQGSGDGGTGTGQSHASACRDNHSEHRGDTGPSVSPETPPHHSSPGPPPSRWGAGSSDWLPGHPGTGRRVWPAPTREDMPVRRKLLPWSRAVLPPGGAAGCQAGAPLQSAWPPARTPVPPTAETRPGGPGGRTCSPGRARGG